MVVDREVRWISKDYSYRIYSDVVLVSHQIILIRAEPDLSYGLRRLRSEVAEASMYRSTSGLGKYSLGEGYSA